MARILIIEDDIEFRGVLKKMLERKDYDVAAASDGEEGLKMFRDSPCALVITDIIMPNKEGVGTISEFQRDFPDTKIIAMSGGGKIKAEKYLKAVGSCPNIKFTFQKPFAMNEMLQAVKEILDQ